MFQKIVISKELKAMLLIGKNGIGHILQAEFKTKCALTIEVAAPDVSVWTITDSVLKRPERMNLLTSLECFLYSFYPNDKISNHRLAFESPAPFELGRNRKHRKVDS